MNTIDIMRGVGLLVTIKPDDSSTQVKQVMGDNEIQVRFQENRMLPFMINDWCIVYGERYLLTKMPVVRKIGTFLYEYDMKLQAEGIQLARAQFMFLGDDNSLKESAFSLMGTASDFIDLLIQNASRVSSGWIKGQVIPTEHKNLTFSKENCYSVLSRLAEAFETEYWVEGKTIHLTKRQTDTGLTFKHGKNKGLYDITRTEVDSASVVTRLYCFGSEKNLPPDYRDYAKLLRMTGGDLYVEKNVGKYGVIEYTEIIDDIYPQRTGKVSSVSALNPNLFNDADIDFNVNDQLLPGITAKIVFNTGQLAGYEFEVSKFNNGTKEFTLLQNKNERVLEIPGVSLRPGIGDEYIITDIIMPPSYITAAEAALKARAMQILDQASEPQLSYQITFDPVFLRKIEYTPTIGQLIWLVDVELQVQKKIRIVSATRNIVNEYDCKADISDTVSVGTISNIISIQNSNGRDIEQINAGIQNNSLLNNNVIGDLTIKQGTIIFQNLPTTSTETGFSQLRIEDSTGKLYTKV